MGLYTLAVFIVIIMFINHLVCWWSNWLFFFEICSLIFRSLIAVCTGTRWTHWKISSRFATSESFFQFLTLSWGYIIFERRLDVWLSFCVLDDARLFCFWIGWARSTSRDIRSWPIFLIRYCHTETIRLCYWLLIAFRGWSRLQVLHSHLSMNGRALLT